MPEIKPVYPSFSAMITEPREQSSRTCFVYCRTELNIGEIVINGYGQNVNRDKWEVIVGTNVWWTMITI
jgi:hypothetical protein